MRDPYFQSNNRGDKTRAHRVLVEKLLGRKLPQGAEIHHVDGDGKNNAPHNLVVCPSKAYHQLLHVRAEALERLGNADARKCAYCSRWDLPDNLVFYQTKGKPWRLPRAFHRDCIDAARRRAKESRR
mgnify:CR=1 FL=1